MSVEAMAAFHRLRIDRRYRLNGTARLILYHLCYRHNDRLDVAYPGTKAMAADLDLHRSAVTSGLRRLQEARLISREQGGGRGRSTSYRLVFLASHRLDPASKQPIDWHYKVSGSLDTLKVSGGLDTFGSESVRQSDQKCPVVATQSVQTTGHKRQEKKKNPPASATGRAGGPRTADDVFRERFAQRDLTLLSVTVGSLANPEACEEAAADELCPASTAKPAHG